MIEGFDLAYWISYNRAHFMFIGSFSLVSCLFFIGYLFFMLLSLRDSGHICNTTFIQIACKKTIGRINVHVPSVIQSYGSARDFTEHCKCLYQIFKWARRVEIRSQSRDYLQLSRYFRRRYFRKFREFMWNISFNISDTHAHLLCSSGAMKCSSATGSDFYHGPHIDSVTVSLSYWVLWDSRRNPLRVSAEIVRPAKKIF